MESTGTDSDGDPDCVFGVFAASRTPRSSSPAPEKIAAAVAAAAQGAVMNRDTH